MVYGAYMFVYLVFLEFLLRYMYSKKASEAGRPSVRNAQLQASYLNPKP